MPGDYDAEYLLLGPLEVRRAGVAVPVVPGRQQVLLAMLLLRAGRLVRGAELIEALWGSRPPPSAPASLMTYVARLRRALGDAGGQLIVTSRGGYQMNVPPGAVDAHRFAAEVAAGRAAARAGDWARASRVLAAALGLWRGEALAGPAFAELAGLELPQLAELRWQAVEARIDADLHLGRHSEVISELQALIGREPLREELHALLMTALAHDGRRAGALAAYHAAARVLTAELGIGAGRRLRELHARILAGDTGPGPAVPGQVPGQAAAGPAPAPAAGNGLPPDTAAFTGRAAELALIAAAAPPPGPDGAVAIRAVHGMPGVGKTALAVHAAHLLRSQFPDRQLFLDLRGHTPGQDPLTPEAALTGLLAASGADPRGLPRDVEGLASAWRDRMAGRRGVVVLDNAASSVQVGPLLPGGGSLVVVTSLRALGDLPGAVVPVCLEVLSAGQAEEMFVRLAPRAAGEAGGRGAVAELAGLAGFLPLAVSLLARVFARHPAWSLGDLVAETRASMLTLAAERDSVAAAFGVSFGHLDEGRRGLLCLLGLHPGGSVDGFAAAALAGAGPGEAGRLLDGLHAEGLLTEVSYRRYGMHDLIRQYAAARAAALPAGERAAAAGRLAGYYQQTAGRAAGLISWRARPRPAADVPVPPAAAPDLRDDLTALRWLRAERSTLLACLDQAARAGQRPLLIALTSAVAELLRRDGPWSEAIARHAAAAQAAREDGDPLARAAALTELGGVQRLAGDQGAGLSLHEALAIYRRHGDRHGEAVILVELSHPREGGDKSAAAGMLGDALATFRDLDDPRGEASALRFLGESRDLAGDHAAAAALMGEAVAIHRRLGNRLGQAACLAALAEAHRMSCAYQDAVRVLKESLAICQELGDQLSEANARMTLGDVRRMTADYAAAEAELAQSAALFQGLGQRLGLANCRWSQGGLRRLSGDYAAADRLLAESLGLYRAMGSRLGEANSLQGLGEVRLAEKDPQAAAVLLAQSLRIYREISSQEGEATTLNHLGAVHLAQADPDQAAAHYRQALAIARPIASARDEATALSGLGRCAREAGDRDVAARLLRRAWQILCRLGDPDAPALAAELHALGA